jgi:formylglycine-generating enzyme
VDSATADDRMKLTATRSNKKRAASQPDKGLRITHVLVILAVGACLGNYHYAAAKMNAQNAARAETASSANADKAGDFGPTIPNREVFPGKPPSGMTWISGGEFSMGAAYPTGMNNVGMNATLDSRPIHRVYVDGFFMDKTDVTNTQFKKFVDATGYVTIAERKPRAQDYPGVPPEDLVAGGMVFTPPSHPVSLDDYRQWWAYVPGANWRHPVGPGSNIAGRDNYPVLQVAYADAKAYAKWAGKRLPSEAEWEFAARGGFAGKTYAWGDQFRPHGTWMANTFQGHFPDRNTGADGYQGIAPIAKYPANGYGLFDMAGNVWQWTSDWYRPDYYQQLKAMGVARNPQGPDSPYMAAGSGVGQKVQRGGSFLCTDQYCSRYMVGTRGKGDIDTGSNHLGFRCVMTSQQWKLAQRSLEGPTRRAQ